jgi:SAM-dependent methyltransferase
LKKTRKKYGTIRTSEKIYVTISDARLTQVFPKLSQLLSQSGVKTLLDYGAGDGLFIDKCLPDCVSRSIHYDLSPAMRSLAKQRLQKRMDIEIIGTTKSIKSGSVGAVTMTAVWMEFPSVSKAKQSLREIYRVLAPGGRLYAAITHPCFRPERFSTHVTDFDNKNYFKEGRQFSVTVFSGRKKALFRDFHWNLQSTTAQLDSEGFLVKRIYEIPDRRHKGKMAKGAPWMIIEAIKIADA